MFPLACIYHAHTTVDKGVAATNFLKTLSTAQRRQKKASEDTMIYKKIPPSRCET